MLKLRLYLTACSSMQAAASVLSPAVARRHRLGVRCSSSPPSGATAPPAPPKTVADATAVYLPLGTDTGVIHCATGERLRMETEFALGRGSSDNVYVLRGAAALALVDVPEGAYAAAFAAALPAACGGVTVDFVVLTHFSPRRADGLAALLAARPAGARPLEVWCSNPAAQLIRSLLAEGPGQSASLAAEWRDAGGLRARLRTVRGGDELPLGGERCLSFALAATPRWPDALVAHDAATARTSVTVHSAPQALTPRRAGDSVHGQAVRRARGRRACLRRVAAGRRRL
jgi:glyoxylase-like metal-dependent hydrolase (beta-lactamase superfamily II)